MTSSQNVECVDLRRLVYSIFAHFYKDYYSTVTPPANIRMDYVIPSGEVFTEAIGTYMLYINRKLSGQLSAISEIVVDHMDHSEGAFISYVDWRSKKLNFKKRSNFASLFCLVFQLVLKYFKNGCFRFSGLAVEVVLDIIEHDQILLNGLKMRHSFEAYKKYCFYYCLAIQHQQKAPLLPEPHDFKQSWNEFPEDLLDYGKKPIIYKRLAEETSTQTVSEYEITNDSNRSIVLLMPKQNYASGYPTDSFSLPQSSSFTARQTRNSTGGIFTCKYCKDDCRDFFRVFVSFFKVEYCGTT